MAMRRLAVVVALGWLTLSPSLHAGQDPMSALVRTFAGDSFVAIPIEPHQTEFTTLAVMAGVPMGIELSPVPVRDPRLKSRSTAPVTRFPSGARVTVADVLNQIQALVPGYEIEMDEGVISIAPSQIRRHQEHYLNRVLENFEVKNVSLEEALMSLWSLHTLGRANSAVGSRGVGAGTASGGGSGMGPDQDLRAHRLKEILSQHVTLSLTNLTLRQALDRLAGQTGTFTWEVSYQDGSVANEHTCEFTVSAVGELGGHAKKWSCR